MITSIRSVDFACKSCGQQAQIEVTRTNDELDPARYSQHGSRTLHYCWDCCPAEVKVLWNEELRAHRLKEIRHVTDDTDPA